MTEKWEEWLIWLADRFDWIRTWPKILFSDMRARPEYLWLLTKRNPKHLDRNIWMWTVEYRVKTKTTYMRLMRRGRFFEAAKFLFKM